MKFQMKLSLKAVAVAASLSFVCGAFAQSTPNKTVVVEPTGLPAAPSANAVAPLGNASPSGDVFVVFGNWLQTLPAPALNVIDAAAPVSFNVVANAQAQTFEAAPVILGQPELPLLGQAAAEASTRWNAGLNYQGVQLSYIVLNAKGKPPEQRAIGRGLAAGEHFKIRYTASFNAVASIDRVVGDVWRGQRVGQAWPQPGSSVQSNPGESVDLPLGGGYFVMGNQPNERFVLSIRHPQAKGTARSDQPVYRQDGARSSSYLQLVPTTKLPALEQVIALRGVN